MDCEGNDSVNCQLSLFLNLYSAIFIWHCAILPGYTKGSCLPATKAAQPLATATNPTSWMLGPGCPSLVLCTFGADPALQPYYTAYPGYSTYETLIHNVDQTLQGTEYSISIQSQLIQLTIHSTDSYRLGQ